MLKPGECRDFGYTSYFEDEDGEITLKFTSYEKDESISDENTPS